MLAPLRLSSIPRGEARHWRKSRQIASCSVATVQGRRRNLSNLSVPSGRMIPATVWRASPRPAGFSGRMVVHLIEQDEADRNRIGKAFFSREDAKPQSPRRPCAGRGRFGSLVPRRHPRRPCAGMGPCGSQCQGFKQAPAFAGATAFLNTPKAAPRASRGLCIHLRKWSRHARLRGIATPAQAVGKA